MAYFSLSFLSSIVGIYQEYKIWTPRSIPSLSLWGMVKVYLFNVVWTTGSLIGSTLLLLNNTLTGHIESEALAVELFLAVLVCAIFVGPIEVRNAEKLPSRNRVAQLPRTFATSRHKSTCETPTPSIGALRGLRRLKSSSYRVSVQS